MHSKEKKNRMQHKSVAKATTVELPKKTWHLQGKNTAFFNAKYYISPHRIHPL